MGYCVIGDIHGCFEEFEKLVQKIDAVDSDMRYILVGDIIDRGRQSMKMLRFAMEKVNKPGSRFQMIIGNHEFEKIKILECFLNSEDAKFPERFSKYAYMDHYGADFAKMLEEEGVTSEELVKIYDFFRNLPYFLEVDTVLSGKKQHYIIVHGSLPSECLTKNGTFRKRALSARQEYLFNLSGRRSMKKHIVWDRYTGGFFGDIKNTIVIHGHTPTLVEEEIVSGAVPGRIFYGNHTINVDCGIPFREINASANLAAIRLEDLQEFYVYEPAGVPDLEGKDGGLKYKEAMLHRPRKEYMTKKKREEEEARWQEVIAKFR